MTAWSVLIDKWKEFRRPMLIKSIIVCACLIIGSKFGLAGVLLILNVYVLYKVMSDNKPQKLKRGLIQALSTTLFILFLYTLNYFVGTFSAVLAFLVVTSVLAAYLLWKQRKQYMEAVRTIETMIWGEPLDHKRTRKQNERKEE